MVLKKVKRETFPLKSKISDSNWNPGIILGNIVIFTGKYKKETKKIKAVYKNDNHTNGFYVRYKDDPSKLYLIYIRG